MKQLGWLWDTQMILSQFSPQNQSIVWFQTCRCNHRGAICSSIKSKDSHYLWMGLTWMLFFPPKECSRVTRRSQRVYLTLRRPSHHRTATTWSTMRWSALSFQLLNQFLNRCGLDVLLCQWTVSFTLAFSQLSFGSTLDSLTRWPTKKEMHDEVHVLLSVKCTTWQEKQS